VNAWRLERSIRIRSAGAPELGQQVKDRALEMGSDAMEKAQQRVEGAGNEGGGEPRSPSGGAPPSAGAPPSLH
jgi:hypothetical protein